MGKVTRNAGCPGHAPAQAKLDAIGIEIICGRIAECESLRKIAASYGVSDGKLVTWLADYPEHYARAKSAQADRFAEEIIELSDIPRIGEVITTKANGDVEVVTKDMVERARLQIDARKWLAGKMRPKVYGDKFAVGGDADAPPISVAVDTSALMAALEAKLIVGNK